MSLTSLDSTVLLLLQRCRRPPASSCAPFAGLLLRNRRPFAAAVRLPPLAALLSIFSGGRAPSSYHCPAAGLLPRTRRRRPPTGSRASTAPQDPTPLGGIRRPAPPSHPCPGEPKHTANRVHSTQHLMPPHVAAYPAITATTHRSQPGSIAQSNQVHVCSPSLSACLTAEFRCTIETTAAVRNTSRRRASQLQVTVSSSCRSSKSGVLDYLIYRVGLHRPSKPTEVVPHCCLRLPALLLHNTRTTERSDGCCCSSTTSSGS